MDLAQLDELLDDLRCDLILKQLLVITEKFFNCTLCINVIFLIGLHGLREEKVDPLRCVHLVEFVAADCTFEELVRYLAETRDQVVLLETLEPERFSREREIKDLHDVLNQVELTQNFLALFCLVPNRVHIEVTSLTTININIDIVLFIFLALGVLVERLHDVVHLIEPLLGYAIASEAQVGYALFEYADRRVHEHDIAEYVLFHNLNEERVFIAGRRFQLDHVTIRVV